jgi:diguanylate cyclase (GGDEF)-like protein
VFFDDSKGSEGALAKGLTQAGHRVLYTRSVSVFPIDKAELDLVIVAAKSKAIEMVNNWQKEVPHLPVIHLVPKVIKAETSNELNVVLKSGIAKKRFVEVCENTARLGNLHRKIHELSHIKGGVTTFEQMFTSLDIHHILDVCMDYFANRTDVANIHWIRWADIGHIQKSDSQILNLEMELAAVRSPRLRSYRDVDIQRVFNLVWQALPIEDTAALLEKGFLSVKLGNQSVLFVTVGDGEIPMGCLVFENPVSDTQEGDIFQIQYALQLMKRFIHFGLIHWESRNLSMIDDLTSLYNQRYLPTIIDHEISRAQRRGQSFSVLFMDLDFFKLVNDTRGHWVGSKVLKEVGQLLKSSIRSCDFGFRYGGDEFVLVLPDTNLNGGQVVAERIRKTIEEARFIVEGHELRLTVSVGLAVFPDHAHSKDQILQLADQAMYYGKRKSRNIVYVAS